MTKEINRIIIDVRNNPGGLLQSSIEISELLLDRGKTIVSTRGKEGSGRVEVFKSQSEPIYRGVLLVAGEQRLRVGVGDTLRRDQGQRQGKAPGRENLRKGIGPEVLQPG